MQSNLISQLKRWLLPAYYYSTLPFRQVGSSLAGAAGKQPIAVLFYHRVADEGPSPWTISNRQFTRQIEWLLRNFDLISLSDAQRRIRERENRRPAVCITFDDGYSDNCRHALPLLISRGIPVTYFVPILGRTRILDRSLEPINFGRRSAVHGRTSRTGWIGRLDSLHFLMVNMET
jgi:hypothetical protein